MPEMLGNYDPPEYAFDVCYEHCTNETEFMVMRMLQTYITIVQDRYKQRVQLTRTSMEPGPFDFRKSKHYRWKSGSDIPGFYQLAESLKAHGHEDPAYFVGYVFTKWKDDHEKVRHAKDIVIRGRKIDPSTEVGFAYPSLTHFRKYGQELIKGYNFAEARNLPFNDYLLPPDKAFDEENYRAKCDAKYFDNRIRKWLKHPTQRTNGVKEEEWWFSPDKWLTGTMVATGDEIRYSKSFLRCARAIHGHFKLADQGVEFTTPEALRTILADEMDEVNDDLDARREEIYQEHRAARARGDLPNYRHIEFPDPYYEWNTEVERERIYAFHEAQISGKDVTDPGVQAEIEAVVNPIDKEHPDTLMFYMYGTGSPRRMDGTEVSRAELEEMSRAKRSAQ